VTRRLVLLSFVASLAFGQSREERLRRDRREQTELDREWRLKYEDDWKAFLKRTDRVYRRWTISAKNDRNAYQADRRSRGLDPLAWKFMHR
jgi:hypothetical protein